jgi:hypothetical protein
MSNSPKPLDSQQQSLINIIKSAHTNLAVARKTKVSETDRRIAESRIRFERAQEQAEARIRVEMDAEVAAHGAALDDALIVAYNHGVPMRRIALDGFGSRYDGAVNALIRELRKDGRVGNRVGYQRNTTEELDTAATTAFPSVININGILAEATTVNHAAFYKADELLELVAPDQNGNDGISVEAVYFEMDARDSWFKEIEKDARVGTQHKHATSCTLYLHPATGELTALESRELGDTIWDHPVARWVKQHPAEARAGFDSALA